MATNPCEGDEVVIPGDLLDHSDARDEPEEDEDGGEDDHGGGDGQHGRTAVLHAGHSCGSPDGNAPARGRGGCGGRVKVRSSGLRRSQM